MVQLEICHIQAILNLEQNVLKSLAESEKPYIVVKSYEQIRRNLMAPNLAVGIFHNDGTLVSMAFLLENAPGKPINGLTVCDTVETLLKDAGKSGVAATVMTAPDFRRRGFMEATIGAIQHAAVVKEYDFIATEVVVGNRFSRAGFIHHAFVPFGGGIDPADGTELEFLTLPAVPSSGKFSPKAKAYVGG